MGVGAVGTQPSEGCVRTLLIDNYDSYTYNLYQMIASVNGIPPIVIMNDELDGEGFEHLVQTERIDNIVISPGPGTPHKPDDAGISLEVFERCRNLPVFGVCFGFQGLCLYHGGGTVVKAPEPVHGRISVVHHNQEDAIFDNNPEVTAEFIAREFLVSAGMGDVAGRVFHILNPEIVIDFALEDGQEAEAGATLLKLHGPVKDVLRGERLALNLVQRLCGIATLTKKYVDQIIGLNVQITDTRKTTPGLRMLEKYAVRVGGARNHRFNLSDGVLIKDNHIAACGSIGHAVDYDHGRGNRQKETAHSHRAAILAREQLRAFGIQLPKLSYRIPSSFRMFRTVCRLIFLMPSLRSSPMMRVKPNPHYTPV